MVTLVQVETQFQALPQQSIRIMEADSFEKEADQFLENSSQLSTVHSDLPQLRSVSGFSFPVGLQGENTCFTSDEENYTQEYPLAIEGYNFNFLSLSTT